MKVHINQSIEYLLIHTHFYYLVILSNKCHSENNQYFLLHKRSPLVQFALLVEVLLSNCEVWTVASVTGWRGLLSWLPSQRLSNAMWLVTLSNYTVMESIIEKHSIGESHLYFHTIKRDRC